MSTSSERNSRTVRRASGAPSSTAQRVSQPRGGRSTAAASPYLPPRTAGLGRPLLDRRARVRAAREPLSRRREPIRHAREVLDDAVVEVARDAAALDLGRVDRTPQQRLALALTPLNAPRE